MKVTVEFSNDCNCYWAPDETLCLQWIESALKSLRHQHNSSVSVSLVSEQTSAELNSKYRGKTTASNVLSFPGNFPDTLSKALTWQPLGDIVICPAIVTREAAAQGKVLQAHWAHMLIHGVLHLLGYDHQTDSDAQTMEQLEINALHTLGISNPYLIG